MQEPDKGISWLDMVLLIIGDPIISGIQICSWVLSRFLTDLSGRASSLDPASNPHISPGKLSWYNHEFPDYPAFFPPHPQPPFPPSRLPPQLHVLPREFGLTIIRIELRGNLVRSSMEGVSWAPTTAGSEMRWA